ANGWWRRRELAGDRPSYRRRQPLGPHGQLSGRQSSREVPGACHRNHSKKEQTRGGACIRNCGSVAVVGECDVNVRPDPGYKNRLSLRSAIRRIVSNGEIAYDKELVRAGARNEVAQRGRAVWLNPGNVEDRKNECIRKC